MFLLRNLSLRASHLGLALLLCLDLRLDRLPIHLNFLVQLGEALISLLLVVLLEETLPVRYDRVDVRLLGNGDVQRFVPLVHLDVHLDRAVVEASAHQDRLGLVHLLAVEGKRGISRRFTWQLLDVVDILNLVSLIDDSKSDLEGVKLTTVNRHGGEAGPQGLLFHESTKSNGFLEVWFLHVLVENFRVGRDRQCCQCAIKSADLANISTEADHLGKFADFGSLFDSSGLVHEIPVHVDGVGVEPGDVLTVRDAAEHVIRLVPHEGVDHVLNLHDLRLVDFGEEHVTVAINEAHLSLTCHVNLIQIHLNDLRRVINLRSSWFA